MNKIEKSILKGMKEAVKFAQGKKTKAIIHYPKESLRIRESLGVSQSEFAKAFGVSVATIRNWEQGRRTPEGPARVLLAVIAKHPQAVFDSIR